MTDLRTAAQQALEALWFANTQDWHGNATIWKAISTLQSALEQPEPQVVYRLGETDIYDFAGWLTTRPGVKRVGASCEAGPMAESVGEYLRAFPDRFTTHSPRREWQGLTDEEMNDCIKYPGRSLFARDGTTSQRIARAIEAALKEKNK